MTGPASETVTTTRNARIAEQAIDWVERKDREDWSCEEQKALDAWLALSPAHLIAFLRVQDRWLRADRLVALRGTLTSATSGGRFTYLSRWTKVVASVLTVGAVLAIWLGSPLQKAAPSRIETRIGGFKVVTLSDGSRIELNTDSVIRSQFDEKRRVVWVDRGEVYFDIVHNPERQFIVLARGGRVIDLGTKFVVRTETNDIRVTLVQGSARIDIPAKPNVPQVRLTSGDSAIATSDSVLVVKQTPQKVNDALGWRRGVLVLDHTTLADAAAEMNRYNERKIIIADGEAAQQGIDGTFPATNVDLFGRVARNVLGLHVTQSGNNIVISR